MPDFLDRPHVDKHVNAADDVRTSSMAFESVRPLLIAVDHVDGISLNAFDTIPSRV